MTDTHINILVLPADVVRIVTQYVNVDAYTTGLLQANPLCRNDVMTQELQDVDTDAIIQFRLAYNIAKHLHNIGAIEPCYDRSTLTGVILSLMHTYSWAQLCDPANATTENGEARVLDMILLKLQRISMTCAPPELARIAIYSLDKICAYLDPVIMEYIKTQNLCDIRTVRGILHRAYLQMCDTHDAECASGAIPVRSIYRTVHWSKYKSQLTSYIMYVAEIAAASAAATQQLGVLPASQTAEPQAILQQDAVLEETSDTLYRLRTPAGTESGMKHIRRDGRDCVIQ